MTRIRLEVGDTFRSLHIRNFRLFFVGQLTSMVGTWLEMTAMTILVFQLTNSGVALGRITALQFLPLLLLGPWGGVLADRLDRHHFMLFTQSAYAALATVLAVLVVTDQITVGLLYVFAVGWGLLTALDNPTRRALVIDMVDGADLANAVGLNTAIMTGSRIVGPALAGLLISGPGIEWCFILNAISFVAVIGALTRMNRSELTPHEPVPREKGQLREGFRYTRRTPELFLPLILVGVMGTMAFNWQVTLPLLAKRSLGGDETTFTWIFATMSLGSLVGALSIARRRSVHMGFLVACGGAMALAMLALAVSPSIPVALLAAVPVGFSAAAMISGSNAVMQAEADPAMRGRVLALLSTVFLGSTPIGAPIVGWVSEQFGARFGLALGAVSVGLVTAWVARRLRRLPAAPAETESPVPTETFPVAAA